MGSHVTVPPHRHRHCNRVTSKNQPSNQKCAKIAHEQVYDAGAWCYAHFDVDDWDMFGNLR